MVEEEREVLMLEPIAEDPEVGRWLSAMEDARRDTLRELETVTEAELDWSPAPSENSIGTILYHIALVEADWLLADILGPEAAPPWPQELLPLPDRKDDGQLTEVLGVALGEHLARLAAVRTLVLEHIQPMPVEDFHRLRARERWDVSPAWVLHHLLQHEAEHRSQLVWLRETQRQR
jgi:uncharacterized damage-inducible protein DinB